MADSKPIELPFPLAGVVRGFKHSDGDSLSDKPFTPWSMNMRPSDLFTSRSRGGSRPGLAPYVSSEDPAAWPTAELMDETAVEIITETGEAILMEVVGSSVLYPQFLEAMQAFGYKNVPEEIGATVGTAPVGATLGCNYRDRLILASGGIVYMSRQGDYTDWGYGADVEDAGRAFMYQLSESGEIGEPVTAIIPHRDQSLIAATAHGLWVMNGDPAKDGTLQNVSRNVGIVSGTAWTKVDDTILLLSSEGVFSVGANGSGLKPVSRGPLPVELADVDPVNHTIMMGYRHSEQGVYIFIEGDQQHWFFDLQDGGFWPFRLPTITVAAAFIADGELVVWDSDGLFWTFEGEDDDGTDVQSHVLIGPFRAGPGNDFTIFSALQGIVETEPDGTVSWHIIPGESAEQASDRSRDAVNNFLDGDTDTALTYVASSGSWVDGRSYLSHPRVRGMWHVLWLHSVDVWAFEGLAAEIQTVGRWR